MQTVSPSNGDDCEKILFKGEIVIPETLQYAKYLQSPIPLDRQTCSPKDNCGPM